MSTSSTPRQTVWSAEEIGFLAGGPGRAAEAVLARLMDGGLVRVSREGLVTAVHQNTYGATTALEAYVLTGLHGAARPIHQVVQVAMRSNEMAALHHGLIARSMVRGHNGNGRNGLQFLLFLLAVATVPAGFAFDARLFVLTAVLVVLIVLTRGRGRLTKHGKTVLRFAFRNPRSGADQVALFGLRQGKRHTTRSTSHGGGCGSSCSTSYDWSHHNCGGSSSSCSSSSSSCSSSSSSCSSSSSSCSSSSSSSCSSSSS